MAGATSDDDVSGGPEGGLGGGERTPLPLALRRPGVGVRLIGVGVSVARTSEPGRSRRRGQEAEHGR